jgi:hypothetical protein
MLKQANGETNCRIANVKADKISNVNVEIVECGFQFHSAATDVPGSRIFVSFNSDFGVGRNQIGRFGNALFVDQDDSSHHQRLSPCARFDQPTFDEYFVYSLAPHFEAYFTPEPSLGLSQQLGRITCLCLSPRGLSYSAGRIYEIQFRSAIVT